MEWTGQAEDGVPGELDAADVAGAGGGVPGALPQRPHPHPRPMPLLASIVAPIRLPKTCCPCVPRSWLYFVVLSPVSVC